MGNNACRCQYRSDGKKEQTLHNVKFLGQIYAKGHNYQNCRYCANDVQIKFTVRYAFLPSIIYCLYN